MTLSVTTIAIVALSVLCAFFAVKWLFKKDTEAENRRRGAAHMAATLKGLGLKLIPEFLVDYSVGDYSGMLHKIGQTSRLFLQGEEAVLSEFKVIFDRLLASKLKTEEGRLIIRAKLDEAEKAAAAEPASPLAK